MSTTGAPAPVSGIDAAFYPACWKVGLAIGLSSETAGYDVAKVLYAESEIRPTSVNSINCMGINQFCPVSYPAGITPAAYVQLPASVQLTQYVLPFWRQKIQTYAPQGISRALDLWWINWGVWRPAHPFVKNAPPDYVINSNVGLLDRGVSCGKTYATVACVNAWLEARVNAPRFHAIRANLAPYAVPSLATVAGLASWATVGIIGAAAAFWWFELRGMPSRRG